MEIKWLQELLEQLGFLFFQELETGSLHCNELAESLADIVWMHRFLFGGLGGNPESRHCWPASRGSFWSLAHALSRKSKSFILLQVTFLFFLPLSCLQGMEFRVCKILDTVSDNEIEHLAIRVDKIQPTSARAHTHTHTTYHSAWHTNQSGRVSVYWTGKYHTPFWGLKCSGPSMLKGCIPHLLLSQSLTGIGSGNPCS